MRRLALLLLLVASITLVAMPRAGARSIRVKVDEMKKTLTAVRRAWAKDDLDAIVKLLPKKDKVTLRLRGVKHGDYRKEQAHALLKKYFEAIETVSFEKVKGPIGTSQKFTHVFRLRADRKQETHTTLIALGREEGRWVILDIREY